MTDWNSDYEIDAVHTYYTDKQLDHLHETCEAFEEEKWEALLWQIKEEEVQHLQYLCQLANL